MNVSTRELREELFAILSMSPEAASRIQAELPREWQATIEEVNETFLKMEQDGQVMVDPRGRDPDYPLEVLWMLGQPADRAHQL